jgi:hypothetical protein
MRLARLLVPLADRTIASKAVLCGPSFETPPVAGPQDEDGVRGSISTATMPLSLILRRPLKAVVSKDEARALSSGWDAIG